MLTQKVKFALQAAGHMLSPGCDMRPPTGLCNVKESPHDPTGADKIPHEKDNKDFDGLTGIWDRAPWSKECNK